MSTQLDLEPDANAYHHYAKPAAPGAPLVFAFHGTGGDERQLSRLVAQILPGAGYRRSARRRVRARRRPLLPPDRGRRL